MSFFIFKVSSTWKKVVSFLKFSRSKISRWLSQQEALVLFIKKWGSYVKCQEKSTTQSASAEFVVFSEINFETVNEWCGACTRCLFFFEFYFLLRENFKMLPISWEPSDKLTECFSICKQLFFKTMSLSPFLV